MGSAVPTKEETRCSSIAGDSTRGVERRLAAVWAAVERACEREDFRPNPSRLCDWCAFKAYCPSCGGDIALADAHRQQQFELV